MFQHFPNPCWHIHNPHLPGGRPWSKPGSPAAWRSSAPSTGTTWRWPAWSTRCPTATARPSRPSSFLWRSAPQPPRWGENNRGRVRGQRAKGAWECCFFLEERGKHHFFWLAIARIVFKGETSWFGVCFLKKTRNSNKYAVSRWGFDQETWNVMVSCRICGWEWRATQLLLFLWRLLESWTYREYFSNKNYGGTMVVLMLFIPPIILFTFTIIYGKFIHIYTTNW